MWLCPEHRKMPRVAVLTNDVILSNPGASLYHPDDEMAAILEKQFARPETGGMEIGNAVQFVYLVGLSLKVMFRK